MNAKDFNALAENYGSTSAGWTTNDFNYDGVVNVLDFDALAASFNSGFVTESVKIVKLEGSFAGHYVDNLTGEHVLSFDITHCTHTGHFTGTATFTNSKGKFPSDVTGVIRSNHHLDLTFVGTGFSGSMTGIASHTGGSFGGDFKSITDGVHSSGTYKVAKP